MFLGFPSFALGSFVRLLGLDLVTRIGRSAFNGAHGYGADDELESEEEVPLSREDGQTHHRSDRARYHAAVVWHDKSLQERAGAIVDRIQKPQSDATDLAAKRYPEIPIPPQALSPSSRLESQTVKCKHHRLHLGFRVLFCGLVFAQPNQDTI